MWALVCGNPLPLPRGWLTRCKVTRRCFRVVLTTNAKINSRILNSSEHESLFASARSVAKTAAGTRDRFSRETATRVSETRPRTVRKLYNATKLSYGAKT